MSEEIGIKAEIERLAAKIEALNEAREAFNERYSNMSEKIGELRSMIISNERGAEELKVAAEKAVDIIKETNPLELLKEVKKTEAKYEILQSGIEANKASLDKSNDEIKTLRDTVAQFRGLEAIQKMKEEMKKEIVAFRKIEANIERHSDKAEGMFVELSDRFREISDMNQQVNTLSEVIKEFRKELNSINTKLKWTLKKGEIEEWQSKIEKRFEEVDYLKNGFEKQEEMISNISSQVKEFKSMVEQGGKIRDEIKERLNVLSQHVQKLDHGTGKIERFESVIERSLKKIIAKEKTIDKDHKDIFKELEYLKYKYESLYNDFRNEIKQRKKVLDNLEEKIKSLPTTALIDKKIKEVDNKIEELKNFESQSTPVRAGRKRARKPTEAEIKEENRKLQQIEEFLSQI